MLIKFDKFPDGQTHLKITNDNFPCNADIHLRIRNFEDIGKLWLLHNVLKNCRRKINSLTIYWLAGARWDRPMNDCFESFDLKVFANAINVLGIPFIGIVDPHSYASLGIITNSHPMPFEFNFYNQFPENKEKLLVIPDAGAQKRGEKFLEWQAKTAYAQCLKTRHGKNSLSISCFAPNYDIQQLVQGRDLIIVDDICDGGATFIAIAEQLRQYHPRSLSLMVTHGIFSKGFEPLKSHFDNVYTTNSFQDFDSAMMNVANVTKDDFLQVYEIFKPTEESHEYFIID